MKNYIVKQNGYYCRFGFSDYMNHTCCVHSENIGGATFFETKEGAEKAIAEQYQIKKQYKIDSMYQEDFDCLSDDYDKVYRKLEVEYQPEDLGFEIYEIEMIEQFLH